MDKAAADVEKLTKAQDRGTKSDKARADASKQTAKAIDDASKRYNKYTDDLAKGERSSKQAIQNLKSFQREFDSLGNKVKAGTDAADRLYQLGRSAEDLSTRIKKANADQAASETQRAKAVQKAADDASRARKKEADDLVADIKRELAVLKQKDEAVSRQIDKGEKDYRRKILQIQQGREEFERAQKAEADASTAASAREAKDDKDKIARQVQLRAEIAKTVRAQKSARSDFERDAARARVASLANDLRATGNAETGGPLSTRGVLKSSGTDTSGSAALTDQQKKIHELAYAQRALRDMPTSSGGGGFFERLFGGSEEKIKAINQRLQDFQKNGNDAGFSAVKLAGNLRGMVIIGALVFFQQLVGAGVALGGTLVSVASAAIQAGAALGGALAAGAAQALPVIGLLAGAWGRVGAVFNAVKQAQKARAQSAFDDATAADRQRAAADGVRSAQEALANAQRAATDAQKGLTDARFAAVRQIEDLVAAEKAAQLQAESAALAQQNAQKSFRQSISSGDISSLAGGVFQVRSAANDVLTSGVARGRAVFDATKATRGGVEGMDSVVQARRAVADASRGIADAQRSLAQAQTQAGETIKQMGSAHRLLEQLLGQLSPSEKRLFDSLERIQARYKKVFTGKGGVLESITDAFRFGVDRANALLHDDRLISAAKTLSGAIGGQLRRIFGFLTSKSNISFFTDMAGQARQNLPKVVTLLEHVWDLFKNIARAGGPAFSAFLDFLGQLTGKADKATGSGSGLQKLEDFFTKGEKYAESFVKLGLAISGLFLAVIGQSAQQGQNAVDSLTKSVQSATEWINSHQKEVRNFFKQAREATDEVLKAVWALSKGLFGLFDVGQVSEFSDFIKNTLLPSLEAIFKIIGLATALFLKLANFNLLGFKLGSSIIQLGIVTLALKVFFSSILGILGKILLAAGSLLGSEGVVAGGIALLKTRALIFAPWIAAIALLSGHLDGLAHTFDRIGDAIGGAFGGGTLGQIAKITAAVVGLIALTKGIKLGAGIIGARAAISGAGASAAGVAGAAAAGGGVAGAVSKVKSGGIAAILAFLGAQQISNAVSPRSKTFDLPKRQSLFQNEVGATLNSITFGLLGKDSRISNQAQKFGDTAEGKLADLTKSGNVNGLLALAAQARQVAKDAGGAGDKFRKFADAAKDAARQARDALAAAIKPSTDKITAADLISGKLDWKTFFDGAGFSQEKEDTIRELIRTQALTKKAAQGIGLAFASGLDEGQTPTKNTVNNLVQTLESMEPRARTAAANTAIGMTKALEDKHLLPAGSAKLIRDSVLKQFSDLRLDSVNQARHNVDDIATVFKHGAKPVGEAASEIYASVKKVLSKLGVSTETKGGVTFEDGTKSDTGNILSGTTKAVGGWIGKQGERGKDKVNTWLGRGEVVLNWAQQRAVNMAMAGRDSLTGIVDRTRAYHAGGPQDSSGYATGGFVPLPGTDFSAGQEPQIAAALRRLAAIMKATIYGISGYRSPAHSVAVGGFANDPHTRGQAADIGVNSSLLSSAMALNDSILKRVGLYRPFYPADPHEINHVQLLQGVAKSVIDSIGGIGKTSTQAIKKIGKAKLDRTWKGLLRRIAQGSLDKVTGAANKRIGDVTGVDLGHAVGAAIRGGKGSGEALMRSISKAQGWNFADWWRIDAQETGHGANEVNPTSTARLRGQFLSMNYGKYGPGSDPSKNPSMSDQIRSMASYIKDRYGNPTKAWAHEQANNWYARGGAVFGSGTGDTVSARLTPGEHVWTAAEVAKAGGHQAMFAMRKMFGGGKQALGRMFAKGGVVGYVEPTIHGEDPAGLDREIDRAQKIISKLGTSVITKKFTDKLSKSLDALIGDGGLLDKMSDAATKVSDTLAVGLKQATFKLTKSGNVIKTLDDVGVADLKIKNLKDVYGSLHDEQVQVAQSLADIASRLKHGNLSSGAKQELVTAQRNLKKRQADIQSAIADNVESQYNAIEQAISARVDKASSAASAVTGWLDANQRLRNLLGGTVLSAIGAPNNEAMGRARQGVLNAQADSVWTSAVAAERAGHHDTALALVAQVQDLRASAIEAVKDGIAADVDEVNRQAGRATASLDIRTRISTALGRVGDLAGIAQDRINATTTQIQALTAKQAAASASGFYDLAETIGDQIADLQVTITEITAQQLSDSIDQVNKAASRRSAQLDLQDRISNLRQAAGDFTGAFADRGNTLLARGANLQQQRGGLSNALMTAMLQGNQGQVETLTDQIAELDVSIQENSAAIASNTVQARQAAIDRITGRGGFLGGVFGGLGSILSGLGALSGKTDTAGLAGLLGQQGNVLQQTGSGLADQLASGFGLDLRGQSPAQIVSTLSGTNFDAIEATFTEEQRTQFEALINGIIENTTSQVSNTQAIKDLTKTDAQSFSSSAWQIFRQAIFDGSGGLLPQYQNPLSAVSSLSPAGFDPSASTRSAVSSSSSVSTSTGDTTVLQITSPTEVFDPAHAAEVLSFKRSLDRAT